MKGVDPQVTTSDGTTTSAGAEQTTPRLDILGRRNINSFASTSSVGTVSQGSGVVRGSS
jgi:hypothetical protein